MVEQRTENPCVRGSSPRVGTNDVSVLTFKVRIERYEVNQRNLVDFFVIYKKSQSRKDSVL